MSGIPGIDSDDLDDIIDYPAPDMSAPATPCPPCPPPFPPPPGIPPPSPPTPPPPPGSTEVKLSVSAIQADGDDGNVPQNVNDGSLATRWSKLGLPAWIQFDMGTTKTLSYVKIAWYRGEAGRIYGFNIQTSPDASTWATAFTGESMGNTAALEMYNFPDVSCRYVRINVTANNQPTSLGNLYASVTEIELWGIGTGTEVPPPPPLPPPPGAPPGSIDTDGIKVLNTIDTTPGKFHRNIPMMNIGTSWGSSSVLEVDAENNGQKGTDGALPYWAFQSREGSFASTGGINYTTRLDYISSTGSNTCGVSNAKSRGTIGRADDTKNCEVTAIFRLRNVLNESTQHHHVSLKPRGDGHGESNECTLQVGGRHPYTSNNRGRHSDLYGVEYTHPDYEMQNVAFVAPFTSTEYPMIPHNTWFGMKFIVYNVNNNQTVHAEMWVDTNPVNTTTGMFNNNWQKVWVFEHSGTRAPTWAGPHCQLRCNLARDFDIAAYNIHEIVPPTATSTTASAEELADRAEYEENTGKTYPTWISQITEEPISADPNTFVPEDQLEAQQIQQDGEFIAQSQSIDQFRTTHRIATTSDLVSTNEDGTSIIDGSRGLEETTTPNFVAVSASELVDLPKLYVRIRRLVRSKIPEWILKFLDEGDENWLPLPIPIPPPPPEEEDPDPTIADVTKSIVLKYNIVGRVTNSIVVQYNIQTAGLTRVTQSMVLKYNIRVKVVKSIDIVYNIIGPAADQFSDEHFDTTHWD